MAKLFFGFLATLVIIFIIPIIVYGLLSSPLGMKTPEGVSSVKFLLGVLISKIGTALLISLLFYYSKSIFYDKWILFSLFFIIMFIFGEIGQVFGPNYSWQEALSGVISEIIYIPLSVVVIRFIMK